jgi:methylenetetrahydrofolate dehydrogenase (NADP+)/methenyltetrahydrofolate cyclohydrolase
MTLIDGKATAAEIKQQIAEEVRLIVAEGGKQPHLAAVLVGHDGGSETYVKNKVIACEQCGFKSTLIRYEADVTEEELLACVDRLNHDADVDGFIVQLPLPAHIDEQKIIMAIDYRKDVDGFHPANVGRMAIGLPCFISATPLGILTLLQHYGIQTSGKKCVVLGRSNIVGKPMAQLMMQKQYGDATVTVCHSHSAHLKGSAARPTSSSQPRSSRLRDCRHGEGRCSHHRRGHHTCTRRHPQERVQAQRRREV